MYTGGEKGGLDPYEEVVVFTDNTSSLYLFPINGHTYNTYTTPTLTTLIMTTPHQPKQIKSQWYYIFWSLATLAVVLGQIYVATSYRTLADALTLTLT